MNVPFVENESIWRKADGFRSSKELADHEMPPIDVLYVVDVVMHFDVIDMRDPLVEAHELVDHGFITDEDFGDFVFGNSVRLWGTQNPNFYDGTRVAKEARAVLAAQTPTRMAAE